MHPWQPLVGGGGVVFTPGNPQRGKNLFIFLNVPCKMPQDNILSRALVLPSENFNAILKSFRYELSREANNTLLN
jgi:hypothetical protein